MREAVVLRLGSEGYPDLLASTPEPPSSLNVLGSLPPLPAVAIVGSRRATPYGLRMAGALARAAAEAGIAVVSGLARGIDAEAHRRALEAGGITWAVLGSGLDRIYPPEHGALAEKIVSGGGAVISELPGDAPPFRGNFPLRNRIISGLAWATAVVEGDSRSGALITARLALSQGRDVFAVPGPADSPMSEAPHRLLREGAHVLTRFEDILEEVPPLARLCSPRTGREENSGVLPLPPGPRPTIDEEKILQLLGSEAARLEDLLRATGWSVERLSRALVQMEVAGLVAAHPGQYYARI